MQQENHFSMTLDMPSYFNHINGQLKKCICYSSTTYMGTCIAYIEEWPAEVK